MSNKWEEIIGEEKEKEYYKRLMAFLDSEYENFVVYPKREEIFSSLQDTPFEDVTVVIIGQDPYHGLKQAHGLAFSVTEGTKIPPSLLNIFKELSSDLDINVPETGYLLPWAKQGVLLLNTVLTVREGLANSHSKVGWEIFTDRIIYHLNLSNQPMVFLLWGKPAQEKEKFLTNKNHLILKAAHPSPLSAYRGFFGCRHFSKANEFLKNKGLHVINWML